MNLFIPKERFRSKPALKIDHANDYAHLEAENARLKEALRECVEVLEKFTCPECKPKNPLCVVTGEPPCEIVSIPKKAREVLGDA
jgi:hypothetical protein